MSKIPQQFKEIRRCVKKHYLIGQIYIICKIKIIEGITQYNYRQIIRALDIIGKVIDNNNQEIILYMR